MTSFAPRSINAVDAAHNVPAVSIMSSTKIHVLFSMSPMIFITVAILAFGRLLSIMAKSAPILLAMALALTTPPTSGETTMTSLASYRHHISASVNGDAYTLSTGISKNP